MSVDKIGYFWYNSEDIRGKCPKCKKSAYNAPELVKYIKLTEGEYADFLAGLWGIEYCPYCYYVGTWEK